MSAHDPKRTSSRPGTGGSSPPEKASTRSSLHRANMLQRVTSSSLGSAASDGEETRLSDNGANDCADPCGHSHRKGAPKGRTIGFKISAPPVLAPRKPSKARNSSDPVETIGISRVDGESRTRARGAIAPTENVAADVRAAWTGLADVISDIPSSSRACARNASLAISWSATCRAS